MKLHHVKKISLILASLFLCGLLPAQTNPKPIILVGYVVKQTPEGTLIDGQIVTPEHFQRDYAPASQNKHIKVTGWNEASPPLNTKIAFLVIPVGPEEYKFVRIVTKADEPDNARAEKIKSSGVVYPK